MSLTELLQKAIVDFKIENVSDLDEVQQLDGIVSQLSDIAQSAAEDLEAAYSANMSLGCIFASQGEIYHALTYFQIAFDIFKVNPNPNENDALFFKACALWNGPSEIEAISSLDYLNHAKKIESLIEANTFEANVLLNSIAHWDNIILVQLIACYLGKQTLPIETQQILTDRSLQNYLEALSFLYGWNGKPVNTLRSASLFKKILDARTETTIDNIFFIYTLNAYSYLQQQTDTDLYISEAFHALDNAHACLENSESPHRRALLLTIVDLNQKTSTATLPNYIQLLLNCFSQEVDRRDVENAGLISNQLANMCEHLAEYMHPIIETLFICFRERPLPESRELILNLLHQFKEKYGDNPEIFSLLEKTISDCVENNFEPTPSLEQTHFESDTNEHFTPAPTNELSSLLFEADTKLQNGDRAGALRDYFEIYNHTEALEALLKIASIQSDDTEEYDHAIENFRLASQHPESHHNILIVLQILTGLKKISDDLPDRHPKKTIILDLLRDILTSIVSDFPDQIDNPEIATELISFADIPTLDPALTDQLKSLCSFAEQHVYDEEHTQLVMKLIQSTQNSSKRHLTALVSLMVSEKNNRETMPLVREAVNNWLESTVRVSDDHVFIKDIEGVVLLARQENLAATYYLARHLAQENKFQQALSVSARILMTASQEEFADIVKNHARNFIEESANKPISKGIMKYISKQEELINYAKDLLDVVKRGPQKTDPDSAIELFLHDISESENPESSYHKYILDISTVGLKTEVVRQARGGKI